MIRFQVFKKKICKKKSIDFTSINVHETFCYEYVYILENQKTNKQKKSLRILLPKKSKRGKRGSCDNIYYLYGCCHYNPLQALREASARRFRTRH